MVNPIINKVFLTKVYKIIEFSIQHIFLSFVLYITLSPIYMFMRIQNSFLKSTLVLAIFLILFRKFIISKANDDKLFGKYTLYVESLISILIVIILLYTFGIPQITFH